MPGEREVVSGMRNSSEIVIQLDLAKAVAGLFKPNVLTPIDTF